MPTKAEQRWMSSITQLGCIVCNMQERGFVPAEVHHIVEGRRRLGHLFSIPLCPGHHRAAPDGCGEVARHQNKTEFERRYGAEYELLEKTKGIINGN